VLHGRMRSCLLTPMTLCSLGCGSSSPNPLATLDSSVNPLADSGVTSMDAAFSVQNSGQRDGRGQAEATAILTLALSIGPIPSVGNFISLGYPQCWQ
jgi:hypothetical protein